MWTRELAWIEPAEAARRLAGLPRLAWLDSAMPHPTLGRYSYVAADPFGVFTVNGPDAFWDGAREDEAPLAALQGRLRRCPIGRIVGGPPFQGGAIGVVGYEFGWELEGRRAPVARPEPSVDLPFYDTVLAFDHVDRRCRLLASGHPAAAAERPARAQARLAAFAAHLAAPAPPPAGVAPSLRWRAATTRERFRRDVERVQAFIRAGDIYQANIAQRFTAAWPEDGDRLEAYRTLRAANPAPFAAFLAGAGGRTILSTSPELFLRCDGSTVETRPIKGTARRAADPVADRAAAAALLASGKDRAENVMIVDLLRNDLSRVCRPASVAVPTLCGLESYAGLHHLVSAVTGVLRPDRDGVDLLGATFPGGSITGAPKLRAMEIIADLEGDGRGVYCGSIGAFGFDGSVALNIAIRTVAVDGASAELRVGGGITILSDPDAEFEETLTKAHRIFDAFPVAAEAGA